MRSFRLKLFYIETDTFREYPIWQRETDTLKYSEIVIIVILKILLIIWYNSVWSNVGTINN